MSAWVGAASVVLLYDLIARQRGRPYACTYIRTLGPVRKTAAAIGYGWLGWHLFRKGQK